MRVVDPHHPLYGKCFRLAIDARDGERGASSFSYRMAGNVEYPGWRQLRHEHPTN